MNTPAPSHISPEWELISVLAETVAFFLVTIDLYGEERLAALHEKISGFLQRALGRVHVFARDPDERFPVGSPLWFTVRAIIVAGGYWVYIHPEVAESFFRWKWSAALYELVGGILIPCIVGLGPIWLLVDAAHLVPRFGIWLLRKAKLKGVLLSLGTVLFVFAKGILVVNLIGELHF
jgi:hypothetical protein